MNVARLCFLTVRRMQSVLPLQGAVNMNVHAAIDVSRQKYVLADPLVTEPSEMVTEKLIRHKSPDTD
jgi:hypothetical protein